MKYHEEEVRSYEEVKADFDAALAEVKSATAKFRNLLSEGGFLTRRSGEAEAVQ